MYILFSVHRNIYVCDLLSHCDCELPMRSHPRASNPAVLSDAACVAKLCIRCPLTSGPQHTACGNCARCKLMVLFKVHMRRMQGWWCCNSEDSLPGFICLLPV